MSSSSSTIHHIPCDLDIHGMQHALVPQEPTRITFSTEQVQRSKTYLFGSFLYNNISLERFQEISVFNLSTGNTFDALDVVGCGPVVYEVHKYLPYSCKDQG
jgi:hypothetical protein